MVKGIYAKNTLLFKQKHDKSEIHKYGDYFIIFNQLILDLLFIANSNEDATHACWFTMLLSRALRLESFTKILMTLCLLTMLYNNLNGNRPLWNELYCGRSINRVQRCPENLGSKLCHGYLCFCLSLVPLVSSPF